MSSYRNFCDFSQIPVVMNQTNLPIIIDPSHCFGTKDVNKTNNIPYALSGMSSGIITGASNVLIDFHHILQMHYVIQLKLLI